MLRALPALLVGAVLLVLGVLFSVVLFGVVAVIGLGVWAWLSWKTRKLRRAARDAAGAARPGGQIIEGEAVVVEDDRISVGNVLPRAPRPGE